MSPKLALERQLDICCNNLKPNYIPYIKRSRIDSFEKLTEEGKEIEEGLEKIKNYKGAPNPANTLIKNSAWPRKPPQKNDNAKKKTSEKEEIAAIKSESNKKPQKPQKPPADDRTKMEKPQNDNEEVDFMPKEGACYRCRLEGHRFKDCENPAKYKYFCYRCGKGKVTVVKCPNCKDRKKNE